MCLMKKLYLLLALAAGFCLYGADIDSRYQVVLADKAIVTEKEAAQTIAADLSVMFGKKIKVIAEKDYKKGTPAVFVGWTKAARQKKIAFEKMPTESWHVESLSGGNVIVTGGRPRGTLYGAYEFLEYAGIRYFFLNDKFIPQKKKISFPAGKKLAGKPYFLRRGIHFGSKTEEAHSFQRWHKMNLDAEPRKPAGLSGFYNERQDGQYNTFFNYAKGFPNGGKPEYFSLHKGKRLKIKSTHGPGQLCLSHPEVRVLVKQQLRAKIAKDKKEAEKNGYPQCKFYLVSICDTDKKCECSGCLALAEKYGAYSGALLDFINDIAREFPQIYIATRAYIFTVDPPKRGIVPEKNVIISLAVNCWDWSKKRDTMSYLSAPTNAYTRKVYEGWGKISKHLDIWDYNILFREKQPTPYTNVHVIRYNMPVFAKMGVKCYFSELEYGSRQNVEMHSFQHLSGYLNMKLQQNPYADAEKIIADFMTNYFGKAAPVMRQLLDFVIEKQLTNPEPMGEHRMLHWKYTDEKFFSRCVELLLEAEKLVKDDPYRLKHVKREWLPIGGGLCWKWDHLAVKPAIKETEVIARMREAFYTFIKEFSPHAEKAARAKVDAYLRFLSLCPSLPLELMENYLWYNTTSITASRFQSGKILLADAADAPGGKAWVMGKEFKHTGKVEFVYRFKKAPKELLKFTFDSKNIPQDEKFHCIKVGELYPAELDLYANDWGRLFRMPGRQKSRIKKYNYGLYYNIKFTGPAYVKGSKSPDAVAIAQVIYVIQ